MKKIILFGGSFNPFHKSHEEIVSMALERNQEDLWILPTYNPWKEKTFLNLEQRIKSLELLYQNNPRVKILDWSKDPEFNYTYRAVQECYNNKIKPILLMGSDTFDLMSKWKNYEQVKDEELIVFNRTNDTSENGLRVSVQYESSEIRQTWPNHQHYLPPIILKYILDLIKNGQIII